MHDLLNAKLSFFLLFSLILFYRNENVNANEEGERQSGDGKRFGSSGPFIPLDEVSDGLDSKTFFDSYVLEKKPLLMRNLMGKSGAIKKWTDEYLRQASSGHDAYKCTIETVKKESRTQQIVEMSFGEFLRSYKRMDIYMVNEVPFFLKKDVFLPQP